jgi:phosphoserine phosphatase
MTRQLHLLEKPRLDHVLTLIAGETATPLQAAAVARVRQALDTLGADTDRPDWLSPDRACDILFAGLNPCQAEAAAQAQLGGGIDAVAQPRADRRKRLLISDMDSTVVTAETLDELADHAGLKDHIAAITARAMNGEIDFIQALNERVGLLRGLSTTAIAATLARIETTPGAAVLVRTMRAHGAHTVLVSGGFRPFTEQVREWCGFDEDRANDLEIEDGQLTGRLIPPIMDAKGKLAALIAIAGQREIPLSCALAVGDGANDLDMIRAAGLGVAFRAKPMVAAQARARIDHADLTALLYIQGYRDEEMVRQ